MDKVQLSRDAYATTDELGRLVLKLSVDMPALRITRLCTDMICAMLNESAAKRGEGVIQDDL